MNRFLLFVAAIIVGLIVWAALYPEPATQLAFRAERAVNGLEYRTVSADGETWHYLVGGPEDGETIVLLHGFGGEKDNWNRFLGHLTGDYRVVVPDLPGFGESARHPDWDYSLVPQRDRVHAFVTALRLGRFHLAGHSMGGHLSILYALEHPEQLASLALINNAGVASPVESEFLRNVNAGNNDLIIRTRDDFDSMMAMVFEEQPFAPWPMRNGLAARAMANADFNAAIFASLLRDFDESLESRLPEIPCPVFIVWGDNDRILDVSAVTVMQQALPTADVVIMENMGHMPILERPRETAEFYRAFLRKQ